MTAVTVENLVKTYPKATGNAVDDVSFTISRGEVFGLLGPNGAGKTTIIGILTTTVRASAGTVRVAGVEVTRPLLVKPRIAVLPQINNLDQGLRAREVLTYHAAYHGVPRAEREARADGLLAEFGLADRARDKVSHYSGGMAQRLMLARALMHEPEVLFLDEPTNNLDPQTRRFLWERIRELNSRGVTVVLTTHDMNEAESLCDRIAIVDHGKVLVLDTPDGLKKIVPDSDLLELHARRVVEQGGGLRGRLAALSGMKQVERVPAAVGDDGDLAVYRLYAEGADLLVPAVIQAVTDMGAQVRDLRIITPSLEDVFIHLTGRNLRR
jgi:ABC-2 type transport system ATP-binding protein